MHHFRGNRPYIYIYIYIYIFDDGYKGDPQKALLKAASMRAT